MEVDLWTILSLTYYMFLNLGASKQLFTLFQIILLDSSYKFRVLLDCQLQSMSIQLLRAKVPLMSVMIVNVNIIQRVQKHESVMPPIVIDIIVV